VGLAGAGAYVTHQDGGNDQPDVAMLTEQPETTPTTAAPATTTTTSAPPTSPPTTAPHPCAKPASTTTSADVTTRQLVDPQLLSLDVDLPVLTQPQGSDPDVTIHDPVCSSSATGNNQLTIGLTPSGAAKKPADLASIDLKALDLNLSVKLGKGATAVDVGLPDVCKILNGGREVTCALDSLIPARIGLSLDTAGKDAGATITVRQGQKTLDVKTVDVLSALGHAAGSLVSGDQGPLSSALGR
jgi:hypothetical protein